MGKMSDFMPGNAWASKSIPAGIDILDRCLHGYTFPTTGFKIHLSIAKAVFRYAQLVKFGVGGVGEAGAGTTTAELWGQYLEAASYDLWTAPSETAASYVLVNVSFSAKKVRLGRYISGNVVRYTGQNSALFFTLIPAMIKQYPAFSLALTDFLTLAQRSRAEFASNVMSAGALIADMANMFYTSSYLDDFSESAVTMSEAYLAKKIVPDSIIGSIPAFSKDTKKIRAQTSIPSMKKMREDYAAFADHLSETEKNMAPTMAPWYVVPKELPMVLNHITKSQQFRNVMLLGPAGAGKTLMSHAVASTLQMPLEIFSCGPNTDETSLTLSLLPKIKKDGEEKTLFSMNGVPSMAEMAIDPAGSYAKLTGKEKTDATEADCLTAIIAKASTDDKYEYVESPIIKALRRGYCVEIQEPTTIMEAGVLVSLNSMLDACAKITLMNGTTVTRHPKSIVFITSNVGYEGCRAMNQSVISRMQFRISMKRPNKTQLKSLVKKQTGFDNDELLSRMIDVVDDVDTAIRQAGGAGGTVGTRELINWAESTKITNDPFNSCVYTVINGSGGDDESLEQDIISSCLAPKIPENEVYASCAEESAAV